MRALTITAKSQLDSLPHEAAVELIGEHVAYASSSTFNTFDAVDRCQIKLADESVYVSIADELRYDVCTDFSKAGKPLTREDSVKIPATVAIITDPYTGEQYRQLIATSTLVLPGN